LTLAEKILAAHAGKKSVQHLFLPIGFLLLALQYLSDVTSILRKSPAAPAAQPPSGKQPEVEQQI
jgi:hypothetical protein